MFDPPRLDPISGVEPPCKSFSNVRSGQSRDQSVDRLHHESCQGVFLQTHPQFRSCSELRIRALRADRSHAGGSASRGCCDRFSCHAVIGLLAAAPKGCQRLSDPHNMAAPTNLRRRPPSSSVWVRLLSLALMVGLGSGRECEFVYGRPIVVGTVMSLSGPRGSVRTAHLARAYAFWAEHTNANGGIVVNGSCFRVALTVRSDATLGPEHSETIPEPRAQRRPQP